jgi:hypothetical protein
MESGCTFSATSPSTLEDDVAVIALEVNMSDFFFQSWKILVWIGQALQSSKTRLNKLQWQMKRKQQLFVTYFGRSCPVGNHKQKRPEWTWTRF